MDFNEFLLRDDLVTGDWVGEVVDNNDPEFSGRCKVRIYGKFDGSSDPDSDRFDIPIDQLPWAYPIGSSIFAGGNSKGAGSLSVPKNGTRVKVRFSSGNIYAPEYFAVQDLNDKLVEEISTSYENSHVLFFDEDENTKVVYTQSKGLEIFNKDSHIVINPDSSITIEHKNTESIIELVGPTINISCNSTVNVTANSRVALKSSECIVNGSSSTKVGPTPAYSATLAEPLWAFLKMLASAVDAKLPSTPGMLSNQAAYWEKLSTSTNVKMSK